MDIRFYREKADRVAGDFYRPAHPETGRTMKIDAIPVRAFAIALVFASVCLAGKQRIIIRLKEPLKAETIQIHAPGISNGRGETRDLNAQIELGAAQKAETKEAREGGLKLDMAVRNPGKGGVQVTLTLPEAGYVELEVIDFYGKHVATLLDGNLNSGIYPLQPVSLKDAEVNGIKFLTLRINGKVALKKVITKVR